MIDFRDAVINHLCHTESVQMANNSREWERMLMLKIVREVNI